MQEYNDHEHDVDLTTIEGIQQARQDLFAHIFSEGHLAVGEADAIPPEDQARLTETSNWTFVPTKSARHLTLHPVDYKLLFEILQASEQTIRFERDHTRYHRPRASAD